MKALSIRDIGFRLASLSVFRGLRADPAVAALFDLSREGGAPLLRVGRYSRFAALVLEGGGNWSDYLLDLTLNDDNAYVRRVAAGETIPGAMEQAAARELLSLELIAALTPETAAEHLDGDLPLAGWDVSRHNFTARFHQRLERVGELGYGVLARYHMFRVEAGILVPVANPDPVDPSGLTGYERERELVAANTRALLEGKPAANVLLYGDSGTGKSTCVKAIANRLWERGLRLIELHSDQLDAIPALLQKLSGNPLKFILFIDDLSFLDGGGGFTALKAALEGSVAAKSPNVAIYATSNRRHLVKERFSQRDGDDVHLRDTLEELGSLSDRFGLVVTFLRPERELYLSIARWYCDRFGVAFDEDARRDAESFALSRGGRSARAARQFAEHRAVSARTK